MYHRLTVDRVKEYLDVKTESGLSHREAAMRAAKASSEGGRSLAGRMLSSVAKPSILILLVAALLTVFGGNFAAAALIAVIAICDACFAEVIEYRAEKTVRESVRATATHARVLRDGAKMKIPSDELVVGDVVSLKAGRVVPADMRLISSDNLMIDESAITGDTTPVRKDWSRVFEHEMPVGERVNCAFAGTVVVEGSGDGIVTSTGMSTHLARLARSPESPERDETPILTDTAKKTRIMTAVSIISAVVVLIFGIIYKNGIISSVTLAAAFAAALLPEGVFAVMTLSAGNSLALMKEDGISVKSTSSCAKLASVTMFCTDIPKSSPGATYSNGTLHSPQSEDCIPLVDGLLLTCGLFEETQTAVYEFCSSRCNAQEVIKAFPQISAQDSGYAKTALFRAESTTISYTRGDAEKILSRSRSIWDNGEVRDISEFDIKKINSAIESLRERSLDVCAVGMRMGDGVICDYDLVFIGMLGLDTEALEGASSVISGLSDIGIPTKILTGQSSSLARTCAETLGIGHDVVITGESVDKMSDASLRERLSDGAVFAELSPLTRARVINVLRSMGHIVAVAGDGMDDVASIEAADVGIAPIHGPDAAKAPAEVITPSLSLAYVEKTLRLGKLTSCNVKKALSFLAATNISELVCVLFAVVLGFASPMYASSLLLLNLIGDLLPPLAFGYVKKCGPKNEYKQPSLIIGGAAFGVFILCLFKIALAVTGYDAAARACVFLALALGQLSFLAVMRAGKGKSIFSKSAVCDRMTVISLVVGAALALCAVYVPQFNSIFGNSAPGAVFSVISIGTALLPVIIHEAAGLILRGRKNGN